MRGANAAVVGILGAALYQPVWTSAILTPYDFALAVTGFVGLAELAHPGDRAASVNPTDQPRPVSAPRSRRRARCVTTGPAGDPACSVRVAGASPSAWAF
jgi:hypothetical protein